MINGRFTNYHWSIPSTTAGRYQVQRDIPYLEEADPAALMDIYLPDGAVPDDGHPLVLFLHGGPLPPMDERPWPKEWRIFQDYGRLAAAKGLAAVVINHRYVGYEGLVQAMSDVQQAQRFLAEKGAEYSVDAGRIARLGFFRSGHVIKRPAAPGNEHALHAWSLSTRCST